jgi:hypothetical protein
MSKNSLCAALLGAAAFAGAIGGAAHAAPKGKSLVMIGLTSDQRLIQWKESKAFKAKDIGPVTNLSGDTKLVGIDFRPATGELYGLGDAGGVYTLDTSTGEATFEAQLTVMGMPYAPLSDSFGVDFNPTVDRLRVIGDTGENLRVNVDDGSTTVDGDLMNPGMPPTVATGVTAAGYTNNDADPNTGTTLFDVDTALDQIVIQAPPNTPILGVTGKLGVDAMPDAGFDIYSQPSKDGTTTAAVRAFATLTSDRSRLYEINLLAGKATLRGTFATTNTVIGLAIPLAQ